PPVSREGGQEDRVHVRPVASSVRRLKERNAPAEERVLADSALRHGATHDFTLAEEFAAMIEVPPPSARPEARARWRIERRATLETLGGVIQSTKGFLVEAEDAHAVLRCRDLLGFSAVAAACRDTS